jgi:hypothetical protein
LCNKSNNIIQPALNEVAQPVANRTIPIVTNIYNTIIIINNITKVASSTTTETETIDDDDGKANEPINPGTKITPIGPKI